MASRNDFLNQPQLLHQIFENSEAATLILDNEGILKVINRRLELITEYSKEELENTKHWKELVLPNDYEKLERYLQLLKANPKEAPENIEISFLNKSGDLKTGFMSAFQIKEQNLFVISVVDITEQKQNENELAKAKDAAINSEKLKTEFLANMSHEIRTPINSIVGFADLLRIDSLDQEKKKLYIEQVINASHDLMLLLEKIITISRLDSGQVKLNVKEFNLHERLQELRRKFETELMVRGKSDIELILQPAKDDPDFVIAGDPLRLSDVLSNLIENAIKFTEEGRIELGYYIMESEEIEGEIESLLFFVKDSGQGIAKNKRKIIFDRFVKVIEKEETIYKGAGLGLAIANDMVKLFGGSIWVESTKGDGSRFFFTYPVGKRKPAKKKETVHIQQEKNALDWSDKEVLVAEDVESNYLYIKELLAPTNIKLLRARDGAEAVTLFEANQHVDLVIMDILMPGMDGYEATENIRKIRTDIPVIAQSAFTFEGDIQDGLYAGCFNDYIMKPYTRKILMAVINKYFPE